MYFSLRKVHVRAFLYAIFVLSLSDPLEEYSYSLAFRDITLVVFMNA
jgi:hypothetical protein